MLWKVAARLVTGPVAFLVAGLLDILLFGLAALRASLPQQARRAAGASLAALSRRRPGVRQ